MTSTPALTAWVEQEQRALWADFDKALSEAINGVWSMAASNIGLRIIGAARLVGATSHMDVAWPLLAGGVYHALLAVGEVGTPTISEAEWARLDTLMAQRGSRADWHSRREATVAAIERDDDWLGQTQQEDDLA